MTDHPTIDSVPVAHTPPGGWTQWPGPVLAGCEEPLVPGAPELRGLWQVTEVEIDGVDVPDHAMRGPQ